METKITSDQIKNTQAFKDLPKAQQYFATKRSGRLAIQHGFNMARNIGFEEYRMRTQARFVTLSIVEELIKTIKSC